MNIPNANSKSSLNRTSRSIIQDILVTIIALSLMYSSSEQAMSQVKQSPLVSRAATGIVVDSMIDVLSVIVKSLAEQETIIGSKSNEKTIETGVKDPKRIVGESKLTIDVQEWNSAWYGSIVVKLLSKPTVNYTVDFAKIEISSDNGEFTVRLPKPIEIQVVSDNAPTTAEYSFVRKWFGADTRQALEGKVRSECNSKAMAEAKKELKIVRIELQKKLEVELGKLLTEKGLAKVKVVLAEEAP